MTLSAITNETGNRVSTNKSSTRAQVPEPRLDVDADCRRKHARKSRLCVKSEPGSELSSSGKTNTQRQYRRLPTPDTSPIRLLPFSPSQVDHLYIYFYMAY